MKKKSRLKKTKHPENERVRFQIPDPAKFSTKLFLCLLLCITLSGTVSAGEIKPGWQVGPIVMCMTRQDVQRIYGEGKFFEVPDPQAKQEMYMLQYKQLGLEILFKNEQIERIVVNYPNFELAAGVKVGSSKFQVIQALGKSYIRENYKHSYQVDIPDYKMIYRGITFDVKNERVVKITVTREE